MQHRIGLEELRRRHDALRLATQSAPVALGRWRVVGTLGSGGMGTVYDAVDSETGARVALKTLFVADKATLGSIKHEFRKAAELAHPNLVPVYELAEVAGLWFFTMQRIQGVDFTSWIRGGASPKRISIRLPITRTLSSVGNVLIDSEEDTIDVGPGWVAAGEPIVPERSESEIRAVLLALVQGIQALHDAGFTHGDIKPENVLVEDSGRVVIVDFGLTRSATDDAELVTAGTPRYMAPEIVGGGTRRDRADWYSVGVMLYESLTGISPYAGGSVLDMFLRKMRRAARHPRADLPELPQDLCDLAMAFLLPDPAERATGADALAILAGDAGSNDGFELASVGFVGREHELTALECAYGMARHGQGSVVHLRGTSGIGKSALAQAFLDGAGRVDGARSLRGRCYERESIPYKAFDGVMDGVAAWLTEIEDTEGLELAAWMPEVVQAFPVLSGAPAFADLPDPAPADARELRRRVRAGVVNLLGALSQRRPVILYIDDLQWSDADSAELLGALLGKVRARRLLIIVGFRPAQAQANPALADYFQNAGDLGAHGSLFDIEVGPLIESEAAELTESLLASRGVLDRPDWTTAILRESGRVPFFIEELARYTLARSDASDLDGLSLGGVLVDRVGQLPEGHRVLVETIAVADKPVAQSVAFAAAGLDAGSLPALLALRNAGMITTAGVGSNAPVAMYHDRIREAVVDVLGPADKAARHLALARTLVATREEAQGPWIYDLVRHLGGAAPLMTDPAERLAAARWNLEAGMRARGAAAFPLAHSCLAQGRSFLPENAWQDHYDLALALHANAVETAYLTAQWDEMEAGIVEVKSQGKGVLDQLPVWEVEIDAASGRQDYTRAVHAAVQVLALLDIELSPDPTMEDVGASVERTMGVLGDIGTDGLQALPDVSDPRVVAAMRVQVRTAPAAYFAAPMLLPILASNLVVTSVDHGLSTATPFALSLFGIVLNTMGLYGQAHEWGQVALRLLDRWEDRTLEACTRHVAENLVCNFLIPLRDTLPAARKVFDIGRHTGDLEYAAYAAHVCSHNSLYAGIPLQDCLDLTMELGQAMEALGEVNAMHVHYPFEQLIRALLGLLPDPARLNGPTFDEEVALRESEETGSHAGQFIVYLTCGIIRLLMGQATEASALLEAGRPFYGAAPSTWHLPLFHQYAAMAAYRSWASFSPEERAALEPGLAEGRGVLETLAGQHAGNFAHRVTMVDAAAAMALGDRAEAATLFRTAADAARKDWVNDAALCLEWASLCLDGDEARAQLRAARDAYASWGATAKVEQLDLQLA